jgi:SAM-dependent methyltransferase
VTAASGAAEGDAGLAAVAAAAEGAVGGMDHEIAAAMARHWWYRGRAVAVTALLGRAGAPRGGRVLDYGCGTGHMGKSLSRFGELFGVDGEQAALDAGRAIGGYRHYAWVGRVPVEGVAADSRAPAPDAGLPSATSGPLPAAAGLLPAAAALSAATPGPPPIAAGLPAGRFSVIACLDVLEHVPDDVRLLSALAALLAPGGRLVVSVPMRPDLFCEVDRLAGHVRRYSPARLARLFSAAGLTPVAASGYVVALLPAAVARRRRVIAGRVPAGAEFDAPAAPVNAALSAVAVAEGRLARYVSLPPGLSQIVVLRRAGEAAALGSAAGAARPDSSANASRPSAADSPVATGCADADGAATVGPEDAASPAGSWPEGAR